MRESDQVNMKGIVQVAMRYAGETMKNQPRRNEEREGFIHFFFFVSSWLIFGGASI
jgi:hypothetical protein